MKYLVKSDCLGPGVRETNTETKLGTLLFEIRERLGVRSISCKSIPTVGTAQYRTESGEIVATVEISGTPDRGGDY